MRTTLRVVTGLGALWLMGGAPTAATEHEPPTSCLSAGEWEGFYHPSNSGRTDASFFVEKAEDEASGWRLVVQLGDEPADEEQFTAEDLEVDADGIAFRFGHEGAMKKCKLAMEERLFGRCRPDGQPDSEKFSEFELKPPTSEAEAASVEDAASVEEAASGEESPAAAKPAPAD